MSAPMPPCDHDECPPTRCIMNYTDLQLQLALAKMLPEKIVFNLEDVIVGFIAQDECEHEQQTIFRWKDTNNSDIVEDWFEVRDTEWLHVCWLIEETLSRLECCYFGEYLEEGRTEQKASSYYWHLSWQQRAIALAKVKGIEIV